MSGKMSEKKTFQRSPVRVFERAIDGGLGAGNLGVVLSRPGVGKTGFLISLAVDKLLQGKKVLYISTKESVEHINKFFDQVFHAMARALNLAGVLQLQLEMERGRHILVYNRDMFSLEKLEQSVAFLAESTGFAPDMVVMDGTPRFESTEQWEIEGLQKLAKRWQAEIWTSANTHREGQKMDDRGVPEAVTRYADHLGVIVNLCPEGNLIKVRIPKDHAGKEVTDLQMELDPATSLLRWR